MKEQRQLTVRINLELYDAAQRKCDEKFGIGLSALIKVFLKAFITQNGVGFYIGDDDLCNLFAKWLIKKRFDRGKVSGFRGYGPYLKDLYDLGNTKKIPKN